MKEKYCIHCFVHAKGKTAADEIRRTRTLTEFQIVFVDCTHSPCRMASVPVRFKRHSYAKSNIWVGYTQRLQNVWAKAHLVTEQCPDGWKSEVAV